MPSRPVLLASAIALVILLASLGLASGRDSRRPGVLPPPGAPDDFRFSLSVAGGGEEQLSSPLAVAVGPRGQIYVADGGLRRVQVFSADGIWQQSIGRAVESDPGPGDLVYPLGVTLDDDGNIYVSDNVTGHVSVFDPLANFLRYVAETAPGDKPFGTPAGLFYRNGLLYVNDIAGHQVVALRADGSVQRVLGRGRGSEIGQMLYPNYTWVDADGRAYVADSNNNRIQIFGPDGQIERVLMSGQAATATSVVRGIALDSRGNLHVASTMEHRVVVLDRAGQYVYAYGDEGLALLGFPNGLAIADDHIYVADRANHRVQVWSFGSKRGGRN